MHLALGFEIGPASSRRAREATIPVTVTHQSFSPLDTRPLTRLFLLGRLLCPNHQSKDSVPIRILTIFD
jgi:hypothetical protein